MCSIKAWKEDATTVRIEAKGDITEYGDMYWAVQRILRYCRYMKKTVLQDICTPTSITKSLQFLSAKSANAFMERLPKKKR